MINKYHVSSVICTVKVASDLCYIEIMETTQFKVGDKVIIHLYRNTMAAVVVSVKVYPDGDVIYKVTTDAGYTQFTQFVLGNQLSLDQ